MSIRNCLWVAAAAASLLLAPTTPRAQELSTAEKLYAELAKLPPAERQKRLEEGAKKEGKLTVVHTLRGSLGNNHIAMFRKRYPFVEVDSSADIGSQDAAERLVAEESAGRHLTDVFTVSGPDMAEPLRRNYVARYPTPATKALLANFQRFKEPENRHVIFYWSEHGISYNTNLVPADKAPKQWMDLCNPFFKGNVSFDPAEARFLSGLYAIMGLEQTEKLLKCIGENEPIIQRGHSQRIELMLAGDHMVQGDNYLYQGYKLKEKNPSMPYAMVLTAPIMANMGVAAINRNTPNPHAAALLVDWFLTEESQKYLAGQGRGPVTIKHPFLPDTITLVDNVDPPKEIADKLMGWWLQHVEKRKK
jgi:iron(III) transport system substrate-binding protein